MPESKKTFFEGLLALLLGIPAVINAFLEHFTFGSARVDKFIKPFFWFLVTIMVLTWLFFESWASLGQWTGWIGDLIKGLFDSFQAAAAAPAVAPAAVVVPPPVS